MPRRRATTRTTPDAFAKALLRNPWRARIVEILENDPGRNIHQIAKELDLSVNAVVFHVNRLAENGLIELRPGLKGRERLCFTKDNVGLWDDPTTRVLFGRGPPRDVAAYLAEHPGAEAIEAAQALGLSVHTVRRHLRTLEECDLVQRMRVDRQVLYHAEPGLLAWLEEVQGEVGERE